MSNTTFIYVYPEDVEVKLTVEYNAVYEPARISGPPEDCYPATSEMEILDIDIFLPDTGSYPDGVEPFTEEFIRKYCAQDSVLKEIEDKCWEDYFNTL